MATSLDDLLAFESEWQGLWEVSAAATPFQSPAWLLPYLRVFTPDPFQVLLVRRSTRLVAVLPLVVTRSEDHSVLRLLGEGISDYLDGVCREEDRSAVCKLFQNWLADALATYECAEFQQLQDDAVVKSIPCPQFLHEDLRPGVPCPILQLPVRGNGAISTLSESMKHNLAVSLRAASEIGDLRLDVSDLNSLDTAISRLFALHAKRWERRGLPGVFDSHAKQTFYRESFRALQRVSALDLFTLCLGSVPIAVLAAFHKGRTLYYYIGAFDPDYAKLGPGNLIILRVLEFALNAGYHRFDFLRGREPYKYRWGAQDQTTYIRRIWRK
jgi:CelD/BcsL family acetyltransferase involved in cellulose biosynthesis